jgi:hypothetical protein
LALLCPIAADLAVMGIAVACDMQSSFNLVP